MALRGGMWAVVFTDLVGSTAQRARVGDEAADELRREHDAIVARAASTHDGHVVKSTGDGCMVAFAGAADGVQAAIAIQQGVDLRNRSGEETFALRVGVSLGDLAHEDGDLFGLAVNEAARVCAQASAGEILLTDLVRVVGGSRLVSELSDRGLHDLKGLPDPVRLWSVSWEPAAEPAPMRLPPTLETTVKTNQFAGRSSELTEMLEIVQRSAEGAHQLILLTGEPGIGKTRLAFEACRAAHRGGALVLYGRCDEEAVVPFQPFVEVVDWYFTAVGAEAVAGGAAGELARLSPRAGQRLGLSADPGAADPETAQYRLFDAVGSWFTDLAAQQPVVVILDDLHWASRPTLLMLRHVLRATVNTALLIIATYRDTDLDREHPLGEMVADFGRLAGARRIPLSGLDEHGVGDLLEQVTRRPLSAGDRDLSQALLLETRGNAFFLTEVLQHLADTGALGADRIEPRSPVSGGIPQGVKAVLGERLNRLGDDVSHVLRIAATIGREFDIPVVSSAGDLTDDAVLDALDRALTARLIEDAGRGAYRFSHALVRSALVDELSTARRLRLHARIASALEELRPNDAGSIAHHWCEAGAAGDQERAVIASREAARRASDQSAFDEAVQVLERVIDLVEEGGADDTIATSLLLDLGDARMAAGNIDGAREVYVGATTRADATDDMIVRAALSFHGPPRIETFDARHEPLILRALAAIDAEESPELAGQLHAALANRLGDDDPRRRDHVAQAVQFGSRTNDPTTRLAVHRAKFWISCMPDGNALKEAEGALDAATELGSVSEALAALQLCIIASSQSGGDAAAREYLDRHRELAHEAGLRHFLDAQTNLEARRLVLAGDHNAAIVLVLQAFEAAPNEWNTLNVASITGQQLRLTDQHAALAQALSDWTSADLVPPGVRTYVQASLALALADSGQSEAGQEVFAATTDQNFKSLQPLGGFARPAELATLSSACVALAQTDVASELLDLVEPWAGAHLQLSMGEYCGPATLFIGRLERSLQRLERAVANLTLAIAEADAAGAPLKAVEARLELAQALVERAEADDAARASSLAGRAREFAAAHGILAFTRKADAIDAKIR